MLDALEGQADVGQGALRQRGEALAVKKEAPGRVEHEAIGEEPDLFEPRVKLRGIDGDALERERSPPDGLTAAGVDVATQEQGGVAACRRL